MPQEVSGDDPVHPEATGLPRALSLFSGAGGLDLGAVLAGASVDLASDRDEPALEVLRQSLGSPTLSGDLSDLLESGNLENQWSGVRPDLLIGGPPCTAFSHAGFWLEYKRKGKDLAAGALSDYVGAVDLFRPRAIVLENVPGLAFKNHRNHLEILLRQLKRLGYKTSSTILNAADFSVAQSRQRLFVVGVRGGKKVDLESWPQFPKRTTSWAFRGLRGINPKEVDEIPKGKYLDLLKQVPPGKNYLVHTTERGSKEAHFRYRGRYWSFLLKLDPREASSTIPAQRVTWNGPFHWTSRHLRIRELARLQAFPDTFNFGPSRSEARRQIGNAVPVLLAASVIWRTVSAIGGETSLPECLEVAARASASYGDIQETYPYRKSSEASEERLVAANC